MKLIYFFFKTCIITHNKNVIEQNINVSMFDIFFRKRTSYKCICKIIPKYVLSNSPKCCISWKIYFGIAFPVFSSLHCRPPSSKLQSFSTIFPIWHFLFHKEITHLNRDISSLTQFGDHSPSLSFIKTLQEVEFNFVAADQNNETWIFFIYSPAKNFAYKFNFFISWLLSHSFKNNYRNIFFEEQQGITPFHSLILFCIYFPFHIISSYTYLYWCRTSIFPFWLCIFGICCCNFNFR